MSGALLAVIIVIFITAVLIVVKSTRIRNYKPSEDKSVLEMTKLILQENINKELEPTGFAYEMNGDYFYSLMNCWQRKMGYCRFYDDKASLYGMIMDCEPVIFLYNGKKWLVEFWKGQYGILTGAEVGVYNTNNDDNDYESITGIFYEAVREDEMLPISFTLKKNMRLLLKREGVHWWLTGFLLGEFSSPKSLTMDISISFPNNEMCSAFVGGLVKLGYTNDEYSVRSKTVSVNFSKPYSDQALEDKKIHKALVQKQNESNCKLFESVTSKYDSTLDKLNYIISSMPEINIIFKDSLSFRSLNHNVDIGEGNDDIININNNESYYENNNESNNTSNDENNYESKDEDNDDKHIEYSDINSNVCNVICDDDNDNDINNINDSENLINYYDDDSNVIIENEDDYNDVKYNISSKDDDKAVANSDWSEQHDVTC